MMTSETVRPNETTRTCDCKRERQQMSKRRIAKNKRRLLRFAVAIAKLEKISENPVVQTSTNAIKTQIYSGHLNIRSIDMCLLVVERPRSKTRSRSAVHRN